MMGMAALRQYLDAWLPAAEDVSLRALLLYPVLVVGLYWLLSSLWAYFQIITRNSPPGPTPLPFFGNFGFLLLPWWLMQLVQFGIDGSKLSRLNAIPKAPAGVTRRGVFLYPHVVLTNMASIYGQICGLYIGNRLIVILNDFDTVKDAMVNHSEVFSDRPSVPVVNLITQRKGTVCEDAGTVVTTV